VYNSLSATFSPFELIHGRIARTPADGNQQSTYAYVIETPQSHFCQKNCNKTSTFAFQVVWNNRKQYTNNDYEDPKFEEGQKILLWHDGKLKVLHIFFFFFFSYSLYVFYYTYFLFILSIKIWRLFLFYYEINKHLLIVFFYY
jgi:hypothetical protein